jgi:TetR/AcrR family transcriptional regulator, cholesterol catabolism regulator
MPRARAKPDTPPAGQAARGRIVAGARRHFFAHGFRGVTMDALAAELGMSKKTLYAHFRSKTALVEAAILDKFETLQADLERAVPDGPADFPTTLRAMLTCLQGHMEEIQPPFVRDVRRETPDLFAAIEVRRAALIERTFGKLFADGRRAGMVRKDLPPGLVIDVLLAAVQAIMNPRKIGDLGLAPQAAFAAIISVILDGALTPTGRRQR